MKYFISVIIILLILSSPAWCILFLPSAGATPNKADKKNYATRSANFDGKNFFNEENSDLMVKTKDIDPLRLSKNKTAPQTKLPVKKIQLLENPVLNDFSVTWFGHSSLLIQMHGMNILFDPVFSKRTSPVSWAGPKRFSEPSIKIEDLPEIDILILTHDHYDHLDYKTIKKIDSKVKKYIVPLGVECHLRKWKINSEKISNMAWWEEININGLTITATPARHFSGRWITGRNQSLWNSYVLKDDYRQIFHSGDSGYGNHFKTIHEKFGDFDFAIMECGQYNKRWPTIHSFPEETAQAAFELGAKITMPVHWGAVVLSTNGWDDSILRFKKKAAELKITSITPYLCQTANLEHPELFQEEWWNENH